MFGAFVVLVPQRGDLVDTLGVAGEEDGVGDVLGADCDVVLHLVARVFAVAHSVVVGAGGQ